MMTRQQKGCGKWILVGVDYDDDNDDDADTGDDDEDDDDDDEYHHQETLIINVRHDPKNKQTKKRRAYTWPANPALEFDFC